MKAVLTKALKSLRITVLGSLGAVLLWALYSSVRWRWAGEVNREELRCSGPKILAFWHARQLMMGLVYTRPDGAIGKGVYTLISRHADGRIIACAAKLLGISSVSGSSSRGGARALREMLKKLRDGFDVCITPDGPRGPRCESKAGALILARESAAPIIPASYSAERRWTFGSWDKMILPKPFSRGVFVVGKALHVPHTAGEEELAKLGFELDARLNALDALADNFSYAEARVHV